MGMLKSKKFQATLVGVISIVLIYVLKVEREMADTLAGWIGAGVGLYVSGHTLTDIVWTFANGSKGKGGGNGKEPDNGGGAAGS